MSKIEIEMQNKSKDEWNQRHYDMIDWIIAEFIKKFQNNEKIFRGKKMQHKIWRNQDKVI